MNTEERLRELENEVQSLMDYLGVKPVTFKDGRTGNPDSPFTHGKRVVKIDDLNREK